MIIRIHIKDPDGVNQCVEEAVRESLKGLKEITDDEKDILFDGRLEKTWDTLERWITYKECLTVEFDTELGTATVMRTSTGD